MDYFGKKEISNSDLTYFKNQINGVDQADLTRQYSFGTLFDAMVTENDKVDYLNRRVNDLYFSPPEFGLAENMAKSFFKDEVAAHIHKQSSKQRIMVVDDFQMEYGPMPFSMPVRCKWDLFMDLEGWGSDLKSTAAKKESQFRDSLFQFDYDRQAAWYMDIAQQESGVPCDKFLFIGVSKHRPHKVFKVKVNRGDAIYRSGRDKYLELAYKLYLIL